MTIIILGNKVADIFKSIVVKKVDNAEVTIFHTVDEFINTANLRAVPCDRLIITQEILSHDMSVSSNTLTILKEFLDAKYPDTFVVSLSKNVALVELCESVFYEFAFNVCISGTLKPDYFRDLATLDYDTLKKTYASMTLAYLKPDSAALPPEESIFNQTQSVAKPVDEPVKPSRSQGIFGGVFGKHNKNQPVNTDAFVQDFQNSAPAPAPMGFDPAPAPAPMGFDPAPAPVGFDPAPMPVGFDQEPAPMGFDPAPQQDFGAPQSFDLGTNTSSFTPAPAPSFNETPVGFEEAPSMAMNIPVMPVTTPSMGTGGLESASSLNIGGMDFNTAAKQYQQDTQKVKIVTKEVIKEVYRDAPSGKGGVGSRYQSITSGAVSGYFLFTGDRRTGVTKAALTAAELFAQKVPTLYVDLDIQRHGSLYFLGIQTLLDSDSAIQNGLNLVKSGKDIKRYAFKAPNFKFEALLSMPGQPYSDADLKESLSQIMFQTHAYKVIVFDCPMENVRLIEELLYSLDVFICVDSDLCGCNNVLTALDALEEQQNISKKALTIMRGKSKYIVKETEAKNNIVNNMEFLEQIFGLDESDINWARVPIAGTVNTLANVFTNLQ